MLRITTCVSEFESDGNQYPEKLFIYGYEIEFGSKEDLHKFQTHPDRHEIENTIKQNVEQAVSTSQYSGESSDLELEVARDADPENRRVGKDYGDPHRFTDSTLEDMSISTENVIPAINATYGLNITSGSVVEQTHELPNSCIHPADEYDTAKPSTGGWTLPTNG
jgi:hypothetical protein